MKYEQIKGLESEKFCRLQELRGLFSLSVIKLRSFHSA